MAYEGNTNTASYITAGIAGGDALTSNLKATKSTDFTKLSNTIANAKALEKEALIKGKLKKDLAEMKADALVDAGKKFKEDAEKSKPRMAGLLAAMTLQGASGYMVGSELKKGMNTKTDTSYVDNEIQKAQDSKLDTSDDAIQSYLNGMYTEFTNRKGKGTGTGGSGKKDTGAVTEPVTGATIKTSAGASVQTTPFGDTPAGKYGQNWYGLSSVIRFAEGTNKKDGYTTMFGHRQFTDMSKHPNSPMRTPWGSQSEAAGAYQFMKPTWGDVQKATGVKDFTPASQEIGARWLTQRGGVNPDQVFTTRAELKGAVDKLAPTWAGLPYSGKGKNGGGYGTSYYGQGGKSFDQIVDVYQDAMGITLK